MNIALIYIEASCFRELLLHCYSGLKPYLIKSVDTVRRWIIKEFERQKLEIKKELADTQSQIHISSDLQILSNLYSLVAIVAYYLDKDLINKATLIGLRRIKGPYTRENIAETIIPVLEDMKIVTHLGYFIADSKSSNDICQQVIYAKLRPDIKKPNDKRVRYLEYILNLAAKAFLFSKDANVFKEDTNCKRNNTYIKKLQELWRKKGPVRKFYNLVLHIRITPQRREEFLKLLKGVVEKDLKGRFKIKCSLHYLY